MAAVAKLKAVLGMDSKQYRAGMSRAKQSTNAFQKSIAKIGVSMAAAFSVQAIIKAGKAIIDFASEVKHASDDLEINSVTLQALNSEALKYGLSLASMNKGLARIKQSQGEVTRESTLYIDALKALKINQDEFALSNTDDALEMLAQGFAKAEDRNAAFTATTVLMGRAAKNATTFLKALAKDGLGGFETEAKKAGTVINDELLTKLEIFGTRMETFGLKVKVFGANALDKFTIAAETAGRAFKAYRELVSGKVFTAKETAGTIFNVGDERDAAVEAQKAAEPETATEGQIQVAKFDRIRKENEKSQKKIADTNRKERAKELKEAKVHADGLARMKEEANKRSLERQRNDARAESIIEQADEDAADILDRESSAIGQGIRTDALAAVGGFVGSGRAELGIADRQLKVAQEQVDKMRDLETIQSNMLERLASIDGKTPPSGRP